VSRCLIVQHVEPEGPYAIGDALLDRAIETDLRAVHAGATLPGNADDIEGLVVMGGPMSAASDEGFPTRRAELTLVADALHRGVPTLGICLGAQILALAAGGPVYPGSAGAEIGWGPVELTEAADSDHLLGGLPVRLTVLHWHGDTFDLPSDGVRLASNTNYPNQAFRIGERAWGLQFHVEVDSGAVSAFVDAFDAEAIAGGGDPAVIQAEADAALADLAPVRDLIVGRFADLVERAGRPTALAARD
jgi:GMP synthase-like glutamine amidotransferase